MEEGDWRGLLLFLRWMSFVYILYIEGLEIEDIDRKGDS